MPDNLLSKIKRSVIEGAACTAAKLEEGARLGKVKLDIIAEENRLDNKYCKLGEMYYLALQAGTTEALKSDADALEQVGAISENHKRIQDLKEKLKNLQQQASSKHC